MGAESALVQAEMMASASQCRLPNVAITKETLWPKPILEYHSSRKELPHHGKMWRKCRLTLLSEINLPIF